MNIKKNFTVKLTLVVIQLYVIRVLGEYHENEHSQIYLEKIILPLRCNFSSFNKNGFNNIDIKKSNESDINDGLIQEINTLICHINTFIENITKKVKLIISKPKIHYRIRRSGFNASSSEKQLQNLESKVIFMQDNIANITKQVQGIQISERLGGLEIISQQLRTTLDDAIRIITTQVYNSENFVNKVMETVDSIQQEVNDLKETFEAQKENPRLLRAEIIDDIKSRYFDGATEKLLNLKSELEKHINFIVHEVYNNQAGNFDLILMFGDSKDMDEATRFAVHKALAFEMESNDHLKDYLKILKLMRNLKFDSNVNDSSLLADILIQAVVNRVEGELITRMKSSNSNGFSEIFNTIYEHYPEFLERIIAEVFENIVDQMEIEKLVNTISTTNKFNPSEIIWLYSALFQELLRREDTDQKAVVTLAFALKEALLDYNTVDYVSRNEGEMIMNDLPDSVENLAFAKRVCIRNVDRNEYLYAASDGFEYNANRRKVFTWIPGDIVTQGYWTVERDGDVYHIKNDAHQEYLYDAFNEAKNMRYVFTWTPKNIDSNQFNWVFEPKGEYVYIKNTDSNEYLFASDSSKDKDRRDVYTWDPANTKSIPGDKVNGSLWSIENCEQ